MTATPERSDAADIFNNIAYEIRLHQALEQDLLCPFHYFAVEDLYLESEEILAKNFAKLVSDAVLSILSKRSIFMVIVVNLDWH